MLRIRQFCAMKPRTLPCEQIHGPLSAPPPPLRHFGDQRDRCRATAARSATWSPGPSSPLISATAICARSAPAAFSLSVVLLVDGLELIARYIPPLALIGAIGSIVHPLTVPGDGTTDAGGQSLSQNTPLTADTGGWYSVGD